MGKIPFLFVLALCSIFGPSLYAQSTYDVDTKNNRVYERSQMNVCIQKSPYSPCSPNACNPCVPCDPCVQNPCDPCVQNPCDPCFNPCDPCFNPCDPCVQNPCDPCFPNSNNSCIQIRCNSYSRSPCGPYFQDSCDPCNQNTCDPCFNPCDPCPPTCAPTVCYVPVTRLKPKYYCEYKCVQEPYTVPRRRCRYVNRYFTKNECRYVPQNRTTTYCRKVPEYYTVCETRFRTRIVPERKCTYEPCTRMEKRYVDGSQLIEMSRGCSPCPDECNNMVF